MTEDAGPMVNNATGAWEILGNDIDLLIVDPTSAAEIWKILSNDIKNFGDNDGDPDGPSFYRPADLFDPEDIDR